MDGSIIGAWTNTWQGAAECPIGWILFNAFIGACLASLAGLAAARLPTKMWAEWRQNAIDDLRHEPGVNLPESLLTPPAVEGLWGPPSHCDHCHTRLPAWQLLPIVGWLLLRGRCAFCQTPIPISGWLAECVGAALGAGLAAAIGASPWVWWWMAGAALLGMAVWIDWRSCWLPDGMMFGLAALGVLGVLVQPAPGPWHPLTANAALWGASAGMGVMLAIDGIMRATLGKPGFGTGDIKLLGALGVWAGAPVVVVGLACAVPMGLLSYAVHRRRRWTPHGPHDFDVGGFPFGPALAAGVLIAWAGQSWWMAW